MKPTEWCHKKAWKNRVDWKPVIEVIRRAKSVAVATHIHPDGDAIGSLLGLSRYLKSLGKMVLPLLGEPVPDRYHFLDQGEIHRFDEKKPIRADAIFILDIGSWDRLGDLSDPVHRARGKKVYIDHHRQEHPEQADHVVIDTSFSSTSEMIFDLITESGGEMTRAIAEPLYVGVVTDTGNLTFGNAGPATHCAAAVLVDTGLDLRVINGNIYQSSSLHRLRLVGMGLQRLVTTCNGKVVHTFLSHEEMRGMGVRPEEMDGFIDIIRSVRNAELFLLCWEPRPGAVKVSMRSRGNLRVDDVAESFGGGGHPYAAGYLVEEPLDAVVAKTLAALENLVRDDTTPAA